MDYIKLTRDLVEKAQKLGSDATEVYLRTSRNLSIQVRDFEVETIEEAASVGIGFRVMAGGRLGFSHCNDLSVNALEDAIKRAITFAKVTTPDEFNVLPDKTSLAQIEGLYDPTIISIPMDKKIQMAIDLERSAMSVPGISLSSGASYREGDGEVFIANSNGLSGSYKSSSCSIGVGVVAEKGDQKNTGRESCTRRFFSDLLPIEEIAAEAARKALELIDPVMISTQRASVIFDSNAAFSLLGGIISAITGDRVQQGASFLMNSLDQSFASSLLTIIDDGLMPKGLGSAPFDGEGVSTQKRILVDKGVLKGFLHNSYTAKRAGVVSTGNASRRGFTSLPGIGTHNLYVEAGQYSPEEIIGATRRGLLVKEVTGYGINPVNGNFSGGASGLWIENGEVIHPVKGVTIAGSASEVLGAIDMMANNLDLNRSMASPTFRVAEMQIGGK
jgi:PmbA protein